MQNDKSESVPTDTISNGSKQNITTMDPNGFINKLIIKIIRELEIEENATNRTKPEMEERLAGEIEFEIMKKIGNGTIRKYRDDQANLANLLKPIIIGLIVELKKQFASKEQAISLLGAFQRVTGDFWLAFTNTLKTFGNFLDLLFSPIVAGLPVKS